MQTEKTKKEKKKEYMGSMKGVASISKRTKCSLFKELDA